MEEKAHRIKTILNSSILKDYPASPDPAHGSTQPKSNSSSPDRHRAFSKNDFFKRLDTFSPVTWFAKPQALSPPSCARYGWENVDVDMLKCVTCNVLICGSLPKSGRDEAYQEAVSRLQERLTAGHKSSCPWCLCPSPGYLEDLGQEYNFEYCSDVPPRCSRNRAGWAESFLGTSMDSRSDAVDDYGQRLLSLVSLSKLLPPTVFIDQDKTANQRFLDSISGVSQTLLSASSAIGGVQDAQAAAPAFLLALTGWHATSTSPGDSAQLLRCDCCRRKVGLWHQQEHWQHSGSNGASSLNVHRPAVGSCSGLGATDRVDDAEQLLLTGSSGGSQCLGDGSVAESGSCSALPATTAAVDARHARLEASDCSCDGSGIARGPLGGASNAPQPDVDIIGDPLVLAGSAAGDSGCGGGQELEPASLLQPDSLRAEVSCRAAKRRRTEDSDLSTEVDKASECCSPGHRVPASSSKPFCTLEEHRSWCPWVASPTADGLPLWKVLHGHLTAHAAGLQGGRPAGSPVGSAKAPFVDNIFSVRKLMKDWTGAGQQQL